MGPPLQSNHSKAPSQYILDLITQEYLRLRDLLCRSTQQLKHRPNLLPQHEVNQEQPSSLQALIKQLQAQVQALEAAAATTSPTVLAATTAATTAVVFVFYGISQNHELQLNWW